jgi:hypothetical protein
VSRYDVLWQRHRRETSHARSGAEGAAGSAKWTGEQYSAPAKSLLAKSTITAATPPTRLPHCWSVVHEIARFPLAEKVKLRLIRKRLRSLLGGNGVREADPLEEYHYGVDPAGPRARALSVPLGRHLRSWVRAGTLDFIRIKVFRRFFPQFSGSKSLIRIKSITNAAAVRGDIGNLSPAVALGGVP